MRKNAKYIEQLEVLILSAMNEGQRANISVWKKKLLVRLDVRWTRCVLSWTPTVVYIARIFAISGDSMAVHEVVYSLEPSAPSSRREQKVLDWAGRPNSNSAIKPDDSETLAIVKITGNKEDPKLRGDDVNL